MAAGITLNLAKNPAGFNQNISAVMQDKSPKDIIITINDNAQDGTDISWLWDVDFDLFGRRKYPLHHCQRDTMPGHAPAYEICGYSGRNWKADVETAIRKRIARWCGKSICAGKLHCTV